MTEQNAFEARLGAAVRSYAARVSSDLDAAELAHRIVAAAPRGRRLARPWRLRPAQALVWLVILGLLIAAFGIGIFVGSQPRPLPAVVPSAAPTTVPTFACPPGSTPDKPGPVDQARPALDSSLRPEPNIRMAFDRRAHRFVVLAGAAGGVATWTFDVCKNTWQQIHPVQEPAGLDGWDMPVYDVDSDLTIVVDRDHPMNVWAYDLQANSWTRHGIAPLDTTLVAYDPLTGLVVAANYAREIWSFDVETDTWTPISQENGPANVQTFAYDSSVDRLIAYAGPIGREATWLLDIRTGTWSMSDVETPGVVWGWYRPAVAYDEAAELTVVGPQAYDASADRWESLTNLDPAFRRTGPMVYDPVNQRLVGYREGDSLATADLLAYSVLTREWTVLLEAQPPTTERGVP